MSERMPGAAGRMIGRPPWTSLISRWCGVIRPRLLLAVSGICSLRWPPAPDEAGCTGGGVPNLRLGHFGLKVGFTW